MVKGLAGNSSLQGAAGTAAKSLLIDPNREDNSLGAQLAGNALEMAGKGAMFGPWGAAVGGAIGLAKGFMADKQEDKQIEANFNNAIQMRNSRFDCIFHPSFFTFFISFLFFIFRNLLF